MFTTRKRGFTLAELLITLAIIGIVATLTIPTLIQKYQERETVLRVKEFYSMFSQAYQLAVLEHGTFDKWGLGDRKYTTDEDGTKYLTEDSLEGTNNFFKMLLPYLNFVSFVPKTKECELYTPEGNMSKFCKHGIVLANGTRIADVHYNTSNCINRNAYCGDFYITTDGKAMDETREDGKTYHTKKSFYFWIMQDRIILDTSDGSFKNQCLTGSNYTRCTYWVIKNGNMDYLHCKDLDLNTKTKCN